MADFVLIELSSKQISEKPKQQPPNLPSNVIAIPTIRIQVKKYIPLNVINNPRSKVALSIQQVPLRQASTLTNYSLQGNQYYGINIAETDKNFYVPFSRGKLGIQSISLKHPITSKFVNKCAPNSFLLNEIEQLKILHEKTKQKLQF